MVRVQEVGCIMVLCRRVRTGQKVVDLVTALAWLFQLRSLSMDTMKSCNFHKVEAAVARRTMGARLLSRVICVSGLG